MVYNASLVAVVKCNGKILRENKDIVSLPFNSEYSILIKNLNSKRCLVNISIDGKDALDSNSIIIDGNDETEIKGFMVGNKVKNRFKFIEKSKQISDYRGDRIDDGIIRIEYWFEKEIMKQYIFHPIHYYYYPYYPIICGNGSAFNNYNESLQFSSPISSTENNASNWTISSSGATLNANASYNSSINYCSSTPIKESLVNEGITVKGTEISQNYNYGSIGILEENSKVIILKLTGTNIDSGKVIDNPITVQTKKVCPTCGKKSKSNIKFCGSCGTFLE